MKNVHGLLPLLLLSCSLAPGSGIFDFLFGGGNDNNDCPAINPVANFDKDRYIEKTWYIQRQQLTSYQAADSLYCVAATYSDEGKRRWFRPAITVRNFSNNGGVNQEETPGFFGAAINFLFGWFLPDDFVLCATDTDQPGQLSVGPCFLPNAVAGPYWVAYVDDDYTMAIVVGGQPTLEGQCGADATCTTVENAGLFNFNGNGEGLWFLSREKVANQTTLDALEAQATTLGLCTQNMRPVLQEGCTYEGATIKS